MTARLLGLQVVMGLVVVAVLGGLRDWATHDTLFLRLPCAGSR
jgi:hypothetical protein